MKKRQNNKNIIYKTLEEDFINYFNSMKNILLGLEKFKCFFFNYFLLIIFPWNITEKTNDNLIYFIEEQISLIINNMFNLIFLKQTKKFQTKKLINNTLLRVILLTIIILIIIYVKVLKQKFIFFINTNLFNHEYINNKFKNKYFRIILKIIINHLKIFYITDIQGIRKFL